MTLYNNISYPQLITFKAIFETSSISKASNRLNVQPASVSQSLKTLEQQLGVSLFQRTTRTVKPTEAGKTLYNNIHQHMNEIQFAVELMSQHEQTPTGKVNISLPRFVYQCYLKDVLHAFCLNYPNIELEISISDALDDRIEKNIDVGIRHGDKLDENTIARPITSTIKDALFVSPDYAKQHGIPKTIEELTQHKFIQYRFLSSGKIAPLKLKKSTDAMSETMMVTMPTAMIVNDTDVIINMAMQGHGVGRILQPIVQDKFDSGELIPVLKRHWVDVPPLHLYYSKEAVRSLRVRVLVEFIVESLL